MTRSILRGYTGKDLTTLSEAKAKPLVEGFLFENDYVMIAAPPKIGKSILVQQLTCALSSGEPFLETFEVPNAVNVWYFATEGKDEDTKDRLLRMSHALPIDTEKIFLFCSAGMRFNTPLGIKLLEQIEIQWGTLYPPKVIIIDALYRALKGSLKDDDVVNEFHQTVGALADRYGAAVIIVHHMKKPVYFEGGTRQERSDDDVFGSTFLKASVDQMYWLDKWKPKEGEEDKKEIVLRCDTQRSGNAIEMLKLKLVEPDPLYYKVSSLYSEEIHRVLAVMQHHPKGMTVEQIMKAANLKRSTFYLCAKELEDLGKLVKTNTRPVIYKFFGDTPGTHK